MKKLLLCVLFASACGGDDAGEELFVPKPECMGEAITPYAGTFPQVISKLAIGSVEDGFDLDKDGKPDNKLAAVSSLAQSAIDDSFLNYDILIPIEYFDFPSVGQDNCVKFAIYLADYTTDKDADGKRAYIDEGDCNDNVAAIRSGMPEMVDGLDNDCDGLADENDQNMPNTTDTADADADGQSVAAGDCNDHSTAIKKGLAEVCHDGLDNDCDGVADRSEDGTGAATACSPYDGTQDLALDPLSLEGGAPLISFKDGTVDGANKLVAGPSIFSVNIPVTDGINLDLKITGATIEGTLAADATTMTGRLGGVIDAKTADTIRGLNVDEIGLTPENSLLDATFANLLGPLLALPKASAGIIKSYPGCRTPDIDVDGDGLEAFCDSDTNDENKSVDTCIDGDGTVVKDEGATQCTTAMKNGKPRFVDGISVEMNFSTSKVKSIKPPM
ncbi:MAG TPA: putative metal-binding motif-containing protein [Kofleriaceae bacterium]